MRSHFVSGRARATAICTFLLVSALAACGAGGQVFQNVGGQLDAGASAGKAMPGGQTGASTAPNGQLALDQRKIVKTGQVTLEVDNVPNALAKVRALAVELGGYVGGAQAGTLDQSASLTLRLPAPRFDDALARLHELGGKVLSEETKEEDVTAAVVDLQARLKNLEASEAQYRLLVARATKVDDILAVQSRLDDVQGQIEQLSAQLKALSNQADLSTLTVTLQPTAKPIQAASASWDPGGTVGAATSALLQIGQALVTIGIWLGIVGLPIALVLLLIGFVLLRLRLLRRPIAPGA
jgi:Domain of unknown function (DUF4349)